MPVGLRPALARHWAAMYDAVPTTATDAAEATAAPGERGDARARAGRARWRRGLVIAVLSYLALSIGTMIVTEVVVLLCRTFGDDPRTELSGVPNFRIVDDRVMAGGQPAAEDVYQKLADRGVTLIVDLRTGAPDDANEDDPELLRSLGIDYLRLPVRDGHAPSDRDVDRFVDAVESSQGVVFVHCGAGVGRTSSMTSAYLREIGRSPKFVEHIGLGSHTLEQMWFVATGDSNVVVQRTSELLDAPRRGWSRIRAAF